MLQQRIVQGRQVRHLLPHPAVVEPAAGRQVHPPRPEVPHRTLGGVADQQVVGLRDRLHPLDVPRHVAGAQVGRRVVFVQPQLAGAGDALRGGHRRAAAAQLPVEVRDGRAQDVDIRALQHAPQSVVARRRRPVVDRRELEHVAVEEHDQLAAARRRADRPGQLADAIGHHVLLELGEVDQRAFLHGIAEHAGRCRAASRRRGHLGRRPRHLLVAPGGLQQRVAGVPGGQPAVPGSAGGRRVAVQRRAPRVLVEPFAGVLAAGMVAGDVRAELRFHVLDQRRQPRRRVAAILRRRDLGVLVLHGAAVPDHRVVRMRRPPPGRRRHADPRQEQRSGIDVQHRLAGGIDAGPVGRLARLRPRQSQGEAHQIDAHFGGQPDLRVEHRRRPAQEREHLPGPVEGDGQLSRRFRPHPQADPVAMPPLQRQPRVVVDVEVGPASVSRSGQVDVQGRRAVHAAAGGDLQRADGVLRPRGPERPVLPPAVRRSFEPAQRNHVRLRLQVPDADVVQVHVAGGLAKPEMHRGVGRLVFGRREIELDPLPGRGDGQRPRARRAQKIRERTGWPSISSRGTPAELSIRTVSTPLPAEVSSAIARQIRTTDREGMVSTPSVGVGVPTNLESAAGKYTTRHDDCRVFPCAVR